MKKDQLMASEVLEGVVANHKADVITFFEIKSAIHQRGFGILMVIFILPLAIPVPFIPGMTTLLVIPVWIFSVQMVLGKDSPWLPQWLGNKSLKRSTLAAIVEKSTPILKKVERFLRPRLLWLSTPAGEKLIGFFAFLMCVSIAIPLPFTNLIPAWGILIMALGLLSKDGIMISLGVLTGSFGLLVTSAILLFGTKAALAIFPWLVHLG